MESLSCFSLGLCQAFRQVEHVKAMSCITWDGARAHCWSAEMCSKFPRRRWLCWIHLVPQNKSNADGTKTLFLVHVWCPVESEAAWVVQVEREIQLMNWWKLEWSHPSLCLGFVSLQGWLHHLVTAFLSRWLCNAEFSYSPWSMPHFLGCAHQHHIWDPDFSWFQALSKPANFCQHFKWSS